MKLEELKKKKPGELAKIAEDLKKKLSDLRFKASANKLKNIREMGNAKKDIARVLTVLNYKNKNK